MFNYFWPIASIIGANTLYNICAKATPAGVSPFASLSVTYFIAALTSVILFFLTDSGKSLVGELVKINWTALAFGLSIVALEFGYICAFRAGWKIGLASLVANLVLACILLLVGILFYKESISLRQIIGMLICLFGLVLINKP